MDPVSHVAFGRMMVALDARRRLGAGAVAACVVGSLAPDADVVLIPFGWDRYLLGHQAATHSLLASVVGAAVLAGALRATVRGSRYLPLLIAACAGCVGHLLLDLGSGADLRPFWPVILHHATLPLFAMADPWLAGFFVLSLLAISIGGRSRARRAAFLMTILVAFTSTKAALYAHARALEARTVPPASFRRAESVWGPFARWSIYETRADVVEAWRVDAASGEVRLIMRVPRDLTDAVVERSREFETVRNFLAVHDVTFAVVSAAHTGPAAGAVVMWSDLRYCRPAVRAGWGAAPGPGQASGVSCALWFGGEFDAAGHPATAFVDIGRLVQSRSAAR
jgi:membrane-bound metal-dependent hydrolase YbcI (DUF457 family)